MYSEEMETLIEATLVNGQLDDKKKAVLIKRAQSEGIDLDELEIYIESILAKRKQSKDAAEDAKEEVRLKKIEKKKGRTCPYCGEPIPALAETCPMCGKLILTAAVNEKIEKKIAEITDLFAEIGAAYGTAEAANKRAEILQKCTELKMYYSSVDKVMIFVADAEAKVKDQEQRSKEAWKRLGWWLLIFWVVFFLICYVLFKNFGE